MAVAVLVVEIEGPAPIDARSWVRPSPRAYLMAQQILDVSAMTPGDRYQWVQAHPDWRTYLEAFEQVAAWELPSDDAIASRALHEIAQS